MKNDLSSSILVSGAGSGIGRATAIALAKKGYRLYLLGRTEETLLATQQMLHNSSRHIVVLADQSNKPSLRDALLQAKPENLCTVVANAGLGGDNVYGPTDRWLEIIETNLTGTYYLINETLPYVKLSKDTYRHYVLVSSVLARIGVPYHAAYCASKAGLLGLMRSYAVEYAGDKILFNALCPGWVDTDMTHRGLATQARRHGKTIEEVREEELNRVPLHKMATPEEISTLLEYLIEQTSTTGQVFDLNGGAFMAP